MPHALLLSPDDQAVSAITGVLEEMSVSCERPLDGVSAAQKLNSRSFDLVLVDCENLPAAKLIFDVCRRGKHGTNPVPIAIVDGRAGLPTAFRLGAELILTKPVAKDQARSTIRTAVSRLRKDEPARTQAPEAAPLTAATPPQPQERAQAAAAGIASQPVKISDSPKAAVDLPPAPVMSSAVDEIVAPPAPEPVASAKPAAEDLFEAPAPAPPPAPPEQLSEDPVMADLERNEATPAPAPVFSAYEAAQPKGRGPMVAVLALAIAGGGLYAAWMYQPGFRALVQPQIDRVLTRLGLAPQSSPAPAPPTPVAPAPSSSKPTPAIPAPAKPSTTSTTSPADPAPPDSTGTSTTSPDAAPATPATAPAATTPAPTPAPPAAKPESPPAARKTEAPAVSSDIAFPDKNDAVLLSSKGAEKRLVHQIPPALPNGAAAQKLQGTVVLKTIVDDTGKVESVRLVEGNPALADAAIHAVKQWRYRPYVRDGKSLPFQTVVLVDFPRP